MKIIISPIFKQFFSGRIWMGLDYELIKSQLENKYKAQVSIIHFQYLKESLPTIPENAVLFYSSVYNPEYLKYIQDTIRYISLKRPDIVPIPNEHQLNSLENKGYQELYKDLLGIEKVSGKYFGDIDDLIEREEVMSYPFVLKKNKGALSSGVQLIKSKEELLLFRKQAKKRNLKETLAFKLNKWNSFKKDSNLAPIENLLEKNFSDVFSKRLPIVAQKFVPSLDCDYKVLVFGDKYFVLRRRTRDKDFRASGSGKFSWVVPPNEILDYAKRLKKAFNVPFISLDIGMNDQKECFLFEYQGTAFGPATVTGSDKYFMHIEQNWQQKDGKAILEEEYAYAINQFINENY